MKRSVAAVFLAALLFLSGCAMLPEQNRAVAPRVAVTEKTVAAKPSPTPKQFDGSGLVWQETPQSTCFSSIAYDKEFDVLAVIFRSNTTRAYLYYDFTQADWDSFTSDSSLGGYYNKNIKGQYSGARIDDAAGLKEKGK